MTDRQTDMGSPSRISSGKKVTIMLSLLGVAALWFIGGMLASVNNSIGDISISSNSTNTTTSSGGVDVTQDLLPQPTATNSLGTADYAFLNAFINGTAHINTLDVTDSVASNLIPSITDEFTLGNSTLLWKEVNTMKIVAIDEINAPDIYRTHSPFYSSGFGSSTTDHVMKLNYEAALISHFFVPFPSGQIKTLRVVSGATDYSTWTAGDLTVKVYVDDVLAHTSGTFSKGDFTDLGTTEGSCVRSLTVSASISHAISVTISSDGSYDGTGKLLVILGMLYDS